MTPRMGVRTGPVSGLSGGEEPKLDRGFPEKSGFSASGSGLSRTSAWLAESVAWLTGCKCHFGTIFEVLINNATHVFTWSQNEGNRFLLFLQSLWSLGWD